MGEENEEQKTSDDLGINSQKNSNMGQQVSQKASQVKDTVQKLGKAAKKISKKLNTGAAKIGKFIAQIASKLGPALPYVAIAVLILFVIIGICGFLMTMPGLLTGNLKQMAQGVADWWQEGYKTTADASVNEENVIEAAEYIRSMGYDLIGYGFVPAKDAISDIKDKGETYINDEGKYIDSAGNEVSSPGSYYDKYGIGYTTGGDNSGGKGTFETAGTITSFLDYNVRADKSIPDVTILRTYLLSDSRMYNIRNYDSTDTFASWVHDAFLKNGESWSKGLISLYKAEDYIATALYTKGEAGEIKTSASTKTMEVKVGWNTNSMKFQLDGWSGRYGLTLEFLLSLHLGTMAPELVTTIARTFDTEVQVYLNKVNQQVTGLYKDEHTTDYIDLEMIRAHENPGGAEDWIGNAEAYNIMKALNLKSQKDGEFKCEYGSTKFVKYLNGEESDKNNIYDDIQNKESSQYYIQNVVYGRDSNSSEEYPEFMENSSWKEFITVEEDEEERVNTSSDNDLEYVISCVNSAITYMKSNYSNWTNYSDSTKKVSDYSTTYVLTDKDTSNNELELEDIVPYEKFKDLRDIIEYKICSFRSTHANEEDKRTLVLSMFVVRTSADHNWDFAVVVYEEQSEKEQSTDKTCTDNLDEIDEVCTPCEKYVETIRDALKAITEDGSDSSGDFKTYLPFIARVVDSWFRDTYFVIPNDGVKDVAIDAEDGKDGVYNDKGKRNNYGSGTGQNKLTGNAIEFVDVDNEYLEKTDEYWTKYETTTNSKGETVYVLYPLKNTGEIDTSTKYIRDVNDEGQEVYKNIATGATELVEKSNLRLVKRHTTSESIEDSEWKKNEAGNVWTVYANKTESGKSEPYELELHNETDDDIKQIARYTGPESYERYFYYQYTDRKMIEQQEDARRGITNPTIKQMFKVRKYYIYDGTEEKAKAIYKDWKKVVNDNGDTCYAHYKDTEYFKVKYSQSDEDAQKERAVEMAIDDFYYYGTGPLRLGKDPRNKSLIGNITINKDTLNAFSILENTHTLDADYQYRDFKELIVELDYFDKEDLSDKPDEVFEWILPEYKESWPIRLVDKSEEYYGTLVHSDLGVTKLRADLGIEEPDPDAEATAGTESSTEEQNKSQLANATGYTEGLDVVSPVTGEVISYGTYKRDNTDFINSKSIENGTKETAKTLEDKGINVEEEVGFIQIKVLDKDAKEALVAACGSNEISIEYDGNTEQVKEADAWNGYYKEYTGVCEGYIITIEGIELLHNDLDTLISNASSLEAAEIKAKTTPNLANDETEKENQKIENAKVELDAAKVVDGKLYIREGAIIGKTTYSTTSEFENYSYIRLILRNDKLKLVENVEGYFDLPDKMRMVGKPYTGTLPAQGVEWLAKTLEGEEIKTSGTYTVVDIGDTALTVGPGVTNSCNYVFEEKGYTKISYAGQIMNAAEVIDVYYTVIDEHAAIIESIFPGITFSENEMMALVTARYQRGSLKPSLVDEIKRYKKGEANNLESVWVDAPADFAARYPGVVKRRRAEYELFVNGTYKEPVY